MYTIVIGGLTPLDQTSRMKTHENNARSRLFCRIAKTSVDNVRAESFAAHPLKMFMAASAIEIKVSSLKNAYHIGLPAYILIKIVRRQVSQLSYFCIFIPLLVFLCL